MKRILVIVIVLFIAIITMAYLYFTGLNSEKTNNSSSLYAAASNSAFIFSFQNDKSILDILKGQTLLEEIVGEEKFSQLLSLKQYLLSNAEINSVLNKQNVYIGLTAGREKNIDFIYCTQINPESSASQLLNALKSAKVTIDTSQKLTRLTLADSSIYYLGIKGNLLLLSGSSKPVINALETTPSGNNGFAEYIKSTSRITKNSLAEVYINFNNLPGLLKMTMPGNLSGELSVLKNQDAYASLIYNFSLEKVLFNGSLIINDANSYYQLYTSGHPQKVSIINIVPENTANYTVYTIENYNNWKKALNKWFIGKKEAKAIPAIGENISNKYHLDLEQVFPKYFKGQLITFELSTSEKIGAIDLTNGEKFEQLLLDISADYNNEIKIFKESDLLYAYFGEPFKKFRRPYYAVIDNFMVFANNASTIQSFLNSYRNNHLLINTGDYSNAVNQLPNNSSITFFADLNNSSNILLRNIYLPYYKHLRGEKGMKDYSTFIWQLSAENKHFQTNVLISKKVKATIKDSLVNNSDSLTTIP